MHNKNKGIIRILKLIFLLALFNLISIVYAAPIPSNSVIQTLPSVIDPGLVQKRLSPNFNPQINALPTTRATKTNSTNNNSAASKQIKFRLTKIIMIGNTRFTQQQLAPLYQNLIGTEISLADLENLLTTITNYYRNKGYILSRAILPPQSIKNGVVTIQIIEGKITQAIVSGKPGRAAPLIQAYGNQVANDQPLNMVNLERYILLANDIPGSDVKAVLVPSPTVPGASELNLVSLQKPAQAFLSYDNYGTRYIGPQQITAGGYINSLFTPGDTNTARVTVAQQTKELNFFEVTHSQAIGDNGLRWLVGGNYARTNPQFLLEPFDVIGTSKMAFANLSYPIVRSRIFNWFVQGSANYLNSDTTILGEPLYNDKIRYVEASTYLNYVDSLRGVSNANFALDQGLDVLGASNADDEVSRLGAPPDFTKITGQASRLQYLGSRFSALLGAEGQYSFNPLLTAEQFSFGGPDYGRGYDPAEIVGDRGVAGKFELRMDTSPTLKFLEDVQYYAFYDAGAVWNINKQIQYGYASGTSAGLGARFTINKYFSGNVYVARPLTRPAANEVAAGEDGNGVRGFFQLNMAL